MSGARIGVAAREYHLNQPTADDSPPPLPFC